jgi:hypothetical protein
MRMGEGIPLNSSQLRPRFKTDQFERNAEPETARADHFHGGGNGELCQAGVGKGRIAYFFQNRFKKFAN